MILAGFHTRPLSWSNWNLEMLFFSEGSKTEAPGERPLEQDENQQQTQLTYGTGPESNPCPIGGSRALSPLPHPSRNKLKKGKLTRNAIY